MLGADARKHRVIGFDEAAQLRDIPDVPRAHFRDKHFLARKIGPRHRLGDSDGGIEGFGRFHDGIFRRQNTFETIFDGSFSVAPHHRHADDFTFVQYLPRTADKFFIARIFVKPVEEIGQTEQPRQKQGHQRIGQKGEQIVKLALYRGRGEVQKRDDDIGNAGDKQKIHRAEPFDPARIFDGHFERVIAVRRTEQQTKQKEGHGGNELRDHGAREGKAEGNDRRRKQTQPRPQREPIVV